MAVMARETWTDERLDDLTSGMNRGFDRVDTDIREVRGEVSELRQEMKAGFERVNDEFKEVRAEMKAGFDRVDDEFKEVRAEMNQRFDAMNRTMVIGFVTLFASIVASVIGAILATQL
jgi:uncharacterized coiled-coil DUF342 family protein